MMADLASLGGEAADVVVRARNDGVELANKQLDSYAAAAGRADKAADSVSRATDRMAAQMAKAASIQRELSAAQQAQAAATAQSSAQATGLAGAIARAWAETQKWARSLRGAASDAKAFRTGTEDLNAHVIAYRQHLERMNQIQPKAAAGSKLLGHEMLNLSRQFSDIAVTGAMGMNPLMILIQQGPQIAETFAMASARGITFTMVLRQLAAAAWAALAPLLPVLLPIAAAIGAVAAAFGLLHRELSKSYPKDITAGMGLSKEQLRRVRDDLGKTQEEIAKAGRTTVHFGDTVMATFTVIGRHITSGPVGDALKWLGDKFGKAFDFIARVVLNTVAGMVGQFTGAFEAIKATWKMLPAALGDIVISTANSVIRTIEQMINRAVDAINSLIAKANAGAKSAGLSAQLPLLGGVDLPEIENQFAGVGAKAGKAATTAFLKGFEKGAAAVQQGAASLAKEIGDEALARARRRAQREAGYAPKGAAAPRDLGDERLAQLNAQLAEAKAAELQAQLGVTHDLRARGELEKKIIEQELAIAQSQIEREIAAIQDNKGLSKEKKEELFWGLLAVSLIRDRVAALNSQAVDERTAEALAKQRLELAEAALDSQLDVLRYQRSTARSETERLNISRRIEQIERDIEKERIKQRIFAKETTAQEQIILAGRLDDLNKEQTTGLEKRLEEVEAAYGDLKNNVEGAATAIKQHDWVKAFSNLFTALKALEDAFKKGSEATFATKAGAVGGALGGIGSLIGGKAGSVLGGIGSGVSIGAALGGPVGAIIGGIGGLFSGLFGGKSAAQKEAERQARLAALQHQFDVGREREALQIRQLEAEGRAVEALAKKRALELDAIDETNRAYAEQVMAMEDAAALAKQRQALEIQLLELTSDAGDQAKALAMRRKDELDVLDPTLRELQQLIYLRQDELKAEEKARDLANQRRALEIELLEASGRSVEALAERRKDELAAMDSSLRDIQSAIYVQQDLTEQLNHALELARQRSDIEVQILEATGRSLEAVTLRRRLELAALDDSLRPLQKVLYDAQDAAQALQAAEQKVADARQALTDAYNAESSALQDTIERFAGFAEALRAFRKELDLGSDSPLSPAARYAVAGSAFSTTSALAAGGDQTAIGSLVDVSKEFLDASKARAATALDYQRDVAKVRQSIDAAQGYATGQVDTASQQLAALNASVSGLIQINTSIGNVASGVGQVGTGVENVNSSVLSVRDAIAQLAAAQVAAGSARDQFNAVSAQAQQLISAQPSAPTQSSTPAAPAQSRYDAIQKLLAGDAAAAQAYFNANPDLQSDYQGNIQRWTGTGLYTETAIQYALRHFKEHGQFEATLYGGRPLFASGAAFMGQGVYAKPTAFNMAWMAEAGPEAIMPLARMPGGRLGVNAAVANDNGATDALIALGAKVERLEFALLAIARNTGVAARVLDRTENEGLPVRALDPTEPIEVRVVA